MALKRLMDILVALVALALLAPLLLLLAALVRSSSPGPALYRARRVGRGGKVFQMYKYRSMVVNADKLGPGLTYHNDPRITPVGHVLRRTRLDELPQLLNVLTGDMSIVGPRPEAPEYVDLQSEQWRKVLAVRPGICGLTQLSFAFDEAELLGDKATADRHYMSHILPAKLALDIQYIERQSLALDLQLILSTLLTVVQRALPKPQPAPAAPAFAETLQPVPVPIIASSSNGYPPAIPQAHGEWRASPRTERRRIAVSLTHMLPLFLLDALAVAAAYWAALAFRFDGRIPPGELHWLVIALPIVVLVYVTINYFFGLYHHLWRYIAASEVLTLAVSGLVGTLILLGYNMLWQDNRLIPLSVIGLGGIFASGLFAIIRYRQRLLTGFMGRLQPMVGRPDRKRTLIIGAGEAGQHLARLLTTGAHGRSYELVGFVDDDTAKIGRRLHGVKVLGDRQAVPQLVAEREVALIVIAIHTISGPALRDLLSICLTTAARIKILPDVLGSIGGTAGAQLLRDITPEDLLGRSTSQVDTAACRDIIAGKVVLITGAAGSIGSELCRQVLRLGPRTLVMLDNNETGLHDLTIGLQGEGVPLVPVVADITHPTRMENVFTTYAPQVVFHAAAYKHVPMMELYPDEAVRVNVFGTQVVADLAFQHRVERFVLISSDKAVYPSSIMGATKRVGELLVMSLNETSVAHAKEVNGASSAQPARPGQSLFTAVRFGNVLGSRGSVVPTFVQQIDRGGPVTVTHPEMTRYFISVSEAVSLVIQAATQTRGGDIFMLDMGQAIQIKDLAHKLIRLRGLCPDLDIPVAYSGIRPGEKLHEELIAPDETREGTAHPKVFRISTSLGPASDILRNHVSHLIDLALEQHREPLMAELQRFVRFTAPLQRTETGPHQLEREQEVGG